MTARRRIRLTAAAAVLALLSTLAVAGLGATPVGAAGTVKVSNNTSIRCAFVNYSTPTDWYFPTTGTPKGLIWLQHGFSENKGHWASYAPNLAAAGYVVFATTLPTADLFGCTLENVGNNRPYLNNIAAMFGSAASGSAVSLAGTFGSSARAGVSAVSPPAKRSVATARPEEIQNGAPGP